MTIKILTEALLLFFAIVGFIEICIRALEFFCFRRYRVDDVFIIVPMRGDCSSAEHIIRLLLAQTDEITTKHGRPEIMIVDIGMDREALEICSMMELEFDSVKLCRKEEIIDCMKGKFL